ncbi:hypothetical protein NECAME_10298 [Necator americanus]|uniref:Uncharacterized protein n=1 Tax=Necator americanus TaxID=51031 RepID=W2T934_NECAM|nr:hypothetical protein NECAME_10298 [Necator americanus]ETN78525.1 hypothetical protein NECAME_10298 [Necator americanus]
MYNVEQGSLKSRVIVTQKTCYDITLDNNGLRLPSCLDHRINSLPSVIQDYRAIALALVASVSSRQAY